MRGWQFYLRNLCAGLAVVQLAVAAVAQQKPADPVPVASLRLTLADALDRAIRYQHGRGHVEQRKIPDVAVAHFLKIKLRACPGGRNANGRQ